MRDITRKQIMLALEGDPDATQAERSAIMAALDGRNQLTDPQPLDRVLKREQVASVFGKTAKWVDWEAKRPGTLLERVYLGGTRSAGFSEASVRAALAARKGKEAA